MILKVADYSRVTTANGAPLRAYTATINTNLPLVDDIAWWLYDNIARVKIMYYTNNAAAYLNYPAPDAVFTSVHAGTKCNCPGETINGMSVGCTECTVTAVISCWRNNDSEFIVMLDSRSYLLNDNGKTIENIVCNYIK